MKKYIKEGMITLDVGANVGFPTIILSKYVGKTGKVYSFEPDIQNFNFLKKNVKNMENVIPYNLAVGNKNGSINLYTSDNLNVDHQTYDSGEKRPHKKVKCITLDKFFKNEKKIDFIKIDIEGFDYYAILGAKNLIKKQKKFAMIGELWPYGLKKAGASYDKYLNLLKSLGMKVRTLETRKTINEKKENKHFYTNFIAYK